MLLQRSLEYLKQCNEYTYLFPYEHTESLAYSKLKRATMDMKAKLREKSPSSLFLFLAGVWSIHPSPSQVDSFLLLLSGFKVNKMSDYVHPDVLTIILARMPLKSILRCTLVCKSWQSLIKSDHFGITHLNWKKPDGLFLMCSRNVESPEDIYALHWDNEKLLKCEDFDFTSRPTHDNYYRIIGSCNGVWCLSDDMWRQRNKVILWNPAIRKWLKIAHHGTPLRSRAYSRVTGFWFDSGSNDYKVIRITNYHKFHNLENPAEVYVYSLNSETWREVSHFELKLRFLYPPAPQAIINGAVHWIVSDYKAEKNIIVSFKFSNEMFDTLELPDVVPYTLLSLLNSKLKPAVIEGSLALVESDKRRCCIWLMQEYGVCKSWTKKVDVELNRGVDRLIGMRNNGDLLIEKRGDLYSYETRSMKETQRLLYSNFDPSKFLTNPYPHFPGITGREGLRFDSIFGDTQDSVDQLVIYIENYSESFALLGKQAVVGGDDIESEVEEETESEDEESESSYETDSDSDETDSENDEVDSENDEVDSENDETDSENDEADSENEEEEI